MTIKPDPFYDRDTRTCRLGSSLEAPWGLVDKCCSFTGAGRLGKTFLLQRYFTAGASGNELEKPHCYFLAEQSTVVTQRLTLARQLVAALPSRWGLSLRKLPFRGMPFFATPHSRLSHGRKQRGRFALIPR